MCKVYNLYNASYHVYAYTHTHTHPHTHMHACTHAHTHTHTHTNRRRMECQDRSGTILVPQPNAPVCTTTEEDVCHKWRPPDSIHWSLQKEEKHVKKKTTLCIVYYNKNKTICKDFVLDDGDLYNTNLSHFFPCILKKNCKDFVLICITSIYPASFFSFFLPFFSFFLLFFFFLFPQNPRQKCIIKTKCSSHCTL